MNNSKEQKSTPDRRQFLKQCGILAAGGSIMLGLEGCGLFDDPEMKVCSLEELQNQGVVFTHFNDEKLMLRWKDEKIETFNMICSHKKCTVEWLGELNQFHCPCHDGIYDKNGMVVEGQPKKPLRKMTTEIRNGEVWVLKG